MNIEFANIFGALSSPLDIAIIAGVVVLLFGGGKVAGWGKALGEGMRDFKKATNELQSEPPKLADAQTSAPAMMETVQPAAAGLPADGTPHTAEAVNIPASTIPVAANKE